MASTTTTPTQAPPSKTSITSCIVVGGCGFVGAHIVDLLLDLHPTCRITVLDLRLVDQKSHPNVEYVSADITSLESLKSIFERIKAEVVIHTASPVHGMGEAIYMKVNVGGTKNLVDVAAATGVKAFVLTSSAGVVFRGEDLINVNEKAPIPTKALDAYNESKAIAEHEALAQNGLNGMLITAIRPAGIFGPGDRQLIPGFMTVANNNQTAWQLGDNNNLFDFTYVTNVALGHVLAASVLLHQHPSGPSDPSLDVLSRVDGTPFFITNGEPVYFWDFAKTIYLSRGVCRSWHMVLPLPVGIVLATAAEWWAKLVGKEPGLTRYRVMFSAAHRYFDIRKAKDLLDYEPLIGVADGIKLAIESYNQTFDEKGVKRVQQ